MNLLDEKNAVENYVNICQNIKNYKYRELKETYRPYQEVFDENLVCPLASIKMCNEDLEFTIQINLELKNSRIVKKVKPTNSLSILNINKVNFTHYEYETFSDWNEINRYTKYLSLNKLAKLQANIDDITDYLHKNYA